MGSDLVWGMIDRDSHPVLEMLRNQDPPKLICATIRESTPVFDGRYVWTAGDNSVSPAILCLDPETGDRLAIGPGDGLFDAAITGFAAAPLAPGRICAAISIGQAGAIRSYIALVSRDADCPKFLLLHEEKLSAMSAGVDRFDPHVAFLPRSAELLSFDQATGKTPIVVSFTGGFGRRIVTFPDARSIRTGRGVVVTTSTELTGACACAGKIYQLCDRPGDLVHAELLCSTLGGGNLQIINHAAINGALAVTPRGVFIFCPTDTSLYFADTPEEPFYKMTTLSPVAFACDRRCELCTSNRLGLLLLNFGLLYQFQDAAHKPLMWK